MSNDDSGPEVAEVSAHELLEVVDIPLPAGSKRRHIMMDGEHVAQVTRMAPERRSMVFVKLFFDEIEMAEAWAREAVLAAYPFGESAGYYIRDGHIRKVLGDGKSRKVLTDTVPTLLRCPMCKERKTACANCGWPWSFENEDGV